MGKGRESAEGAISLELHLGLQIHSESVLPSMELVAYVGEEASLARWPV